MKIGKLFESLDMPKFVTVAKMKREEIDWSNLRKKGDVLEGTRDIIQSMHSSSVPRLANKESQRDILRLASLYGTGVYKAKRLRAKRSSGTIDSSAEFSPVDLETASEKLLRSSHLLTTGVFGLKEAYSAATVSLSELLYLMEFVYQLKFSHSELCALADSYGALEGNRHRRSIDFTRFTTALNRFVEKLKDEDRHRRQKENEDRRCAVENHQSEQHSAHSLPNQVPVEVLTAAITKLSFACVNAWQRELKFLSKLMKSYTSDSMDGEKIRYFCQRNLNCKLSSSEAAALLLFLDREGNGCVSSDYFLSQVKLLGLERRCDISLPSSLETKSVQTEAGKKSMEPSLHDVAAKYEAKLAAFHSRRDDYGGETTDKERGANSETKKKFVSFVREEVFLDAPLRGGQKAANTKKEQEQTPNFVPVCGSEQRFQELVTGGVVTGYAKPNQLDKKSGPMSNQAPPPYEELKPVAVASQSTKIKSSRAIAADLNSSSDPRADATGVARSSSIAKLPPLRFTTDDSSLGGLQSKMAPALSHHVARNRAMHGKSAASSEPCDTSGTTTESDRVDNIPNADDPNAKLSTSLITEFTATHSFLPTSMGKKLAKSSPGGSAIILRAKTPINLMRPLLSSDTMVLLAAEEELADHHHHHHHSNNNVDHSTGKNDIRQQRNLRQESSLDSPTKSSLNRKASTISKSDLPSPGESSPNVKRRVQEEVAHMPLDIKGSRLFYSIRWRHLYSLHCAMSRRRCSLPKLMAKLREKGKKHVPSSSRFQNAQLDTMCHIGLWIDRKEFRSALVACTENGADLTANDYDVLFSSLDARRRGACPLFELSAWLAIQDKIASRVSSIHRTLRQVPRNRAQPQQLTDDNMDNFKRECGVTTTSAERKILPDLTVSTNDEASSESVATDLSFNGVELIEIILTSAVLELDITNNQQGRASSSSSSALPHHDSSITANGGWLPQGVVEQLLSGICSSVEGEILISQLLVALFSSGNILRKPCFLRGYSTHPSHQVFPLLSTDNSMKKPEENSGLSLLQVLCVSVSSIVDYCAKQRQQLQRHSSNSLPSPTKRLPILAEIIAEQVKSIVDMLMKDK